jgi:single-stranded-DNA-specific exonuclease
LCKEQTNMALQKRWQLKKYDDNTAHHLHKVLGIKKSICNILASRKIEDYDAAKEMFRPDLKKLHNPFLMKDMDKATQRIIAALEGNEGIMVFGDYDVDGTTSVAMMYSFLSTIHNKVSFYIPHRYREGYGLSKMGIDHAKDTNCTLIVCLDCGIKSVDLIAYAKTLGIDFIVCDHHTPDDILPQAVAILNAKQPDCTYPYKELCGCGVGFKLIQALCELLDLGDEKALEYLDLVATAIAADIVPITDENRILTYYGLQKINTNPNHGINALITLSKAKKPLNVSDVVFVIAPRVNAAGRMDEAKKAVQLFISQTFDEALLYAAELQTDNLERRETDASISDEALKMIHEEGGHKKSTVLYQPHWHKGVVGIVASRLIDNYYKPTIVLTKSGDIVAGSARSVHGFNVYDAIDACSKYLLGYGGHFYAAGMTMEEHQVIPFTEAFEKIVASRITESQLTPKIDIDTELYFDEITPKFYDILKQMEPFGPDNMRPVFISYGAVDTGTSKIVKEAHLKLHVRQGNIQMQGIGFNMAEKFDLLANKQPVDILYTLDENEWNNNITIQMRIIDVRIAASKLA